jgi:hypothetical protein
MATLPKQISLFTEDNATFSQEGSHANHTATQVKGSAKKMTATCGQKCLEQYAKFSRHGSWAKTLAALLVGMEDWYSTRCKLTWKLKGTKYNRLYFQLVPSTLPTDGTGFGLLPTPKVTMPDESNPTILNNRIVRESGEDFSMNLQVMASMGLLKTPTAQDAAMENMKSRNVSGSSGNLGQEAKNGFLEARLIGLLPTPREAAARGNASNDRNKGNLEDAIARMMLPTPDCSDRRSDNSSQWGLSNYAKNNLLPTPLAQDAKQKENSPSQQHKVNELSIAVAGGSGSQLNPRFVSEMMGFPPDWLELPFQSTETNQ